MKPLKIIMLTILFCTFYSFAFSQDIITLKNGEEIKARVDEVGKYEIWYKKYDNMDGPTYSMPVSDIFMIKYPNGDKDVFTVDKPPYPQPTPPMPQYYNKKDPLAACLLSCVLAGGGQYYNGQYTKGALMTTISVLSFVGMIASAANATEVYDPYYHTYSSEMTAGFAMCSLIFIGNGLWSIVDAPLSSNKINNQNKLLSWELNKNTRLSVKPDVNLCSDNMMGGSKSLSPSYGAKLSLNFR